MSTVFQKALTYQRKLSYPNRTNVISMSEIVYLMRRKRTNERTNEWESERAEKKRFWNFIVFYL